MKYFLLPFGCQMNLSDTERVRTVLQQMGYEPTDNEEEANILGIIACSVRQKSIDKVYGRIEKWNAMKNRQNVITFVSGCILPADRVRFLKLFDLVFTMNELPQLPEMIRQYGVVTPASLKEVNPSANMEPFWEINPLRASGFEAYIPIQNGCNNFCTYCAVPYTRGREVSRPSEEILNEVKELVEKDYKSITLLGQNVNSYGLDKKGEEINFAELLRRIGEYGKASGKEFWVYYTAPHPRDMEDEIMEVMAQYDCLAKQIHIPIQSGDDVMLQRMNRHHNLERYRHIIQTIREKLPTATIFTDIIVGFTHESEEEFENTRKAMEEFKYNMAFIAQYSVREGAVASRWEDDVPKEVKRQRYHRLTEELMKHSLIYNQALVGTTVKMLVEQFDRKNGYLAGHTEGKIVIRFASKDTSLIGQIVNVKVTSASPLSIEGELSRD